MCQNKNVPKKFATPVDMNADGKKSTSLILQFFRFLTTLKVLTKNVDN